MHFDGGRYPRKVNLDGSNWILSFSHATIYLVLVSIQNSTSKNIQFSLPPVFSSKKDQIMWNFILIWRIHLALLLP